MLRAVLTRHPDSASPAVRGVEVFVDRNDRDTLVARYVLDADLERLRLPVWRGICAGERLWEHTCFELFVSRPGVPAYHELNFAPSGAWAAYAFERYRERAPPGGTVIDPQIVVRGGAGTLELEAAIALERLAPAYVRVPLELGLSAVIEDEGGGHSYWALAHPGAKPDFHHRDAFQTVIPAPGGNPVAAPSARR